MDVFAFEWGSQQSGLDPKQTIVALPWLAVLHRKPIYIAPLFEEGIRRMLGNPPTLRRKLNFLGLAQHFNF